MMERALHKLIIGNVKLRVVCGVPLLALLTACSTTSNLPDGEELYTGISEIAYGRKADNPHKDKQKTYADSAGVITSLYNAYSTIEDIFSGSYDARALLEKQSKDKTLTARQRDSIRQEMAIYDDATAAVKEEVEAALAYAPNNSVFGSSSMRWPFPIGLWMYNRYVKSHTMFGRWMFNTFATKPVFISTVNPQLRTQVARNTLRNYGFFRGRVEYEVQTDPSDSLKAKIAYSVFPQQLFRLGTIEHQFFGTITDSLIRATNHLTNLHTGDAFNVPKLDAERTRLSELFRNNGFYLYRPEYITFRADTVQTPLTAHLQVRPRADMPAQAKNRFYMGNTSITVMTYDDYQIVDSMMTRDRAKYRWSGQTGRPPLRYGAIRHNLFYDRGSLYRQRLHELIQEKLSGMGIFSSIQMNYTPRDTSSTCDTLDVNIFAILDRPYDSQFDAKLTNKSNGLLGPGLSWSLTKRNAFRGAELLTFNVYGSYEWQTGVESSEGRHSMLNSYEFGTSATLTYPRLMFFRLPFVRKLNRRAQATTTYKLDANWLNRAGYFQMVSFGGRIAYTYQRRRKVKHEFVPLRLDYNLLVDRSTQFDSIMNANQALYVSMRDQLVPSMAYTFTYSPRPVKGHSRALILSAKEAGNIVNTIYSWAGHGVQERNKKLLGVPFAEFFKLTAEYRETFPVTASTSLATRFFAGAVWSYGNSTMAPYSDLFTVGGANSIRAFGVRTIGPGSYHPANSGWSYVDQVGNFKLEANVEYRFPIVGGLNGAVFLDAGNIWLMRPDEARPGAAIDAKTFFDEIALGTGFGFRYDLDFLVLRFDIGVGIHSPYKTKRSGYYNMPRFWDSLGFHIAVGYPF